MPLSSIVFPQLKGLGFPIKKTPQYKTLSTEPMSARSPVRLAQQLFPTWQLDLPFNYLKGDEADAESDYQQLVGHFGAMLGQVYTFPFQDQNDNAVTQDRGFFGLGDGVSLNFQLRRQIGLLTDIVQLLNGDPAIYINGQLQPTNAYAVDNTVNYGVISFAVPPAAGAVLTWEGQFYYAVHYASDSLDQMELIMAGLWDAASIKLEGVQI